MPDFWSNKMMLMRIMEVMDVKWWLSFKRQSAIFWSKWKRMFIIKVVSEKTSGKSLVGDGKVRPIPHLAAIARKKWKEWRKCFLVTIRDFLKNQSRKSKRMKRMKNIPFPEESRPRRDTDKKMMIHSAKYPKFNP